MVWDILLAFLASAGVLFVTGCVIELLLPRRGRDVTLLYARGDGALLEQQVRRHMWGRGGRLVIVDCGLDLDGQAVARRLCRDDWVCCCRDTDLPDFWNGDER